MAVRASRAAESVAECSIYAALLPLQCALANENASGFPLRGVVDASLLNDLAPLIYDPALFCRRSFSFSFRSLANIAGDLAGLARTAKYPGFRFPLMSQLSTGRSGSFDWLRPENGSSKGIAGRSGRLLRVEIMVDFFFFLFLS